MPPPPPPFPHQLPRWHQLQRQGLGEAGAHSPFLGSSLVPGIMVLSHVPTVHLVSWVWQACSWRSGEGPSGGWSDGLCLQVSTACCYFSSVPGAAAFLWESQMFPQLSDGFSCSFLHSHSSIMPDVETCARGPGWSGDTELQRTSLAVSPSSVAVTKYPSWSTPQRKELCILQFWRLNAQHQVHH